MEMKTRPRSSQVRRCRSVRKPAIYGKQASPDEGTGHLAPTLGDSLLDEYFANPGLGILAAWQSLPSRELRITPRVN